MAADRSLAHGEVARTEGLFLCPEDAATYAAYKQARADGRVAAGVYAFLYNCASGLKYPMPEVTRRLTKDGSTDFAAP